MTQATEQHPVQERTIDQRDFRDTLGRFASGITIISGIDDQGPVGFTCQSFCSVSAEPPLVSFSVMTSSTTYPRVRDTGRFVVNVLAHDQHAVSNQFARKGADKWAGISWTQAASGNPVIAETIMWLDCDIWQEFEAGDHYIVVGRVNEMSPGTWHQKDPLLYYRGEYRHLRDTEA